MEAWLFPKDKKDDASDIETSLEEDHIKLLGRDMKFDQAGNPSNIIWENKPIPLHKQAMNWVMALITVTIISIIAVWFIITIKVESNELNSKYVHTNCVDFYNNFSDKEILDMTANSYIEELEQKSGLSNYTLSKSCGAIRCFCSNSTNEVVKDKEFEFVNRFGQP